MANEKKVLLQIGTATGRILFSFIFLMASLLHGQVEEISIHPELSYDTERIMEMEVIDNTVLNEALIVHELNGLWYFPLETTSDSLGFSINVSLEKKIAEGFIRSEDNPVIVNLAECFYTLSGEKSSFPCHAYINFDSTFYIEKSVAEKIFEVKFDVLPFKSYIGVSPNKPLPVQLANQREEQAGLLSQGKPKTNFKDVSEERKWIDGFTLSQTIGSSWNEQADKVSTDGITTLNAEALYGDFYYQYSWADKGVDPDIGNIKWIWSNPYLRLLQVGDVFSSNIPLIGNGQFGHGVILSNKPLNSPSHFGSQDFEGFIGPNWEVELYRNDQFIERQNTNSNGGYSFKNIALVFGVNRFTLKYYGPRGEKRVETKTYNIQQNLTPSNSIHYSIEGTKNEGTGYLRSNQNIQFGLGKYLSASLSAAYSEVEELEDDLGEALLEPNSIETNYYSAQLSGYLRSMYLSYLYAFKTPTEFAEQFEIKTLLGKVSLNSSLTNLYNFRSTLVNSSIPEDDQTSLDKTITSAIIQSPLPFSANFYSTVKQTETVGGSKVTSGEMRVGFWVNKTLTSLIYGQVSSDSKYAGMEVQKVNFDSIFRLKSRFFSDSSQEYSTEYEKKVSPKFSILPFASHTFSPTYSATNYGVRINALTKYLTLGFDVEKQPNNLLAHINLNTGIGIDSTNSVEKIHNESLDGRGILTTFVYILSEDGTKKIPIKEAKITWLQGQRDLITDEYGKATFLGLPVYSNLDFAINISSLSNIYWAPREPGLSVVLRPGKPTLIEFEVSVLGELSGSVLLNEKGKAQVPVLATDLKSGNTYKSKSEFDGYFFIDKLPQGKYKLKVDPDYLKLKGLSVTPTEIDASIDNNGSSEEVQFIIKKIKETE